MRFRSRSKERGTRVKDRTKNGVSKRAGRGEEERKETLPSPPPPPLSFFGFCFISRAAKTENPVPRSFFAPKPNGNACYWKFFIPFPDVKSQLQSSKCHCSGQRNACSHRNPVPIFNFCKCFLACVARVSVRFRCKQRETRVTQCYCFFGISNARSKEFWDTVSQAFSIIIERFVC